MSDPSCGTEEAPFQAVMVFSDPVDWYRDLQLITDVVMSGQLLHSKFFTKTHITVESRHSGYALACCQPNVLNGIDVNRMFIIVIIVIVIIIIIVQTHVSRHEVLARCVTVAINCLHRIFTALQPTDYKGQADKACSVHIGEHPNTPKGCHPHAMKCFVHQHFGLCGPLRT